MPNSPPIRSLFSNFAQLLLSPPPNNDAAQLDADAFAIANAAANNDAIQLQAACELLTSYYDAFILLDGRLKRACDDLFVVDIARDSLEIVQHTLVQVAPTGRPGIDAHHACARETQREHEPGRALARAEVDHREPCPLLSAGGAPGGSLSD